MVEILYRSGHLFLCQINPVNHREKAAMPAPRSLVAAAAAAQPSLCAASALRLSCVLTLCSASLASLGLRGKPSGPPLGETGSSPGFQGLLETSPCHHTSPPPTQGLPALPFPTSHLSRVCSPRSSPNHAYKTEQLGLGSKPSSPSSTEEGS